MITATTQQLWPHQAAGIAEVIEAIQAGEQLICLTSPTGGGKSLMMCELIQWACDNNMPVVLYTHRKMLFDQTAGVLDRAHIEFGRRASGHRPALLRDVQLAMIQSEASAVGKGKRDLHAARLVLIDEAHVNAAGTCESFIKRHVEAGAAVVGVTATPLDIGHIYTRLIVAGCNSSLRECGALVRAVQYGPDEPDLSKIKQIKIGEDLTEAQNRKAIMRPGIFSRVYENWKQLNPEARPALLFGPDVAGSLYFAEQFHAKGVSAAHIDGEKTWIDGHAYLADQEARDDVRRMSEAGDLRVVCNRFVMREGIDWPHIYHGIFATVFGSLASFLQSGGRILRAHHSLDHVVIQDHGGNWWRHGSLNADRQWELNQSAYVTTGMRLDAMREKKEPEPIVCPKCHAIRLSGPLCGQCGHSSHGRSRMVVQSDGSLRKYEGEILKPRKTALRHDTLTKWKRCYMRAKNSKKGMTFKQAEGLFFYEEHYWPPHDLPFMPTSSVDWFRKVRDVPADNLT